MKVRQQYLKANSSGEKTDHYELLYPNPPSLTTIEMSTKKIMESLAN